MFGLKLMIFILPLLLSQTLQSAAARLPYNQSRDTVIRGLLRTSLVRRSGSGLERRQTFTCPNGAFACTDGSGGCCDDGTECATDASGDPICSGGSGGGATCQNATDLPCQDFDFCCPPGDICVEDDAGNQSCDPSGSTGNGGGGGNTGGGSTGGSTGGGTGGGNSGGGTGSGNSGGGSSVGGGAVTTTPPSTPVITPTPTTPVIVTAPTFTANPTTVKNSPLPSVTPKPLSGAPTTAGAASFLLILAGLAANLLA